ncbi:MAG: hypothetical protein Q4G39_08125, partial [Brachymonas sp.]|nr:hypothetical protein [Brachymonas sp.]
MDMDIQDSNKAGQGAVPAVDLGPLSWVVDSVRDNLHGAREQLEEFGQQVREASGSHLTTLDTTPLRGTAQSLHDTVGVLDLVERPAAAQLVGAMERAVQKFVAQPELCTEQAIAKLNHAGNAVLDYLSSVLRGQADHSVGLFPVYRDVAQIAGFDRIHPADLWHQPWRWLEAEPPVAAVAQATGEEQFFESVLKLFQSGGTQGADTLSLKTQHVWQRSQVRDERVFWQLATGYLQALAAGALPFDEHVKRLLSRIAVQYDVLQQGGGTVSERLAQDLLYFNALAHKANAAASMPVNQAIVQRYGLQASDVSAYDNLLYGRVDPSLRDHLRREIAAFKEAWSDVSAGNLRKLPDLSEQVPQLGLHIQSLWPSASRFAGTLQHAVQKVQQDGQAPNADVAMEVATSVLFLEASLDEYQGDDAVFGARSDKLAERIEAVQSGQQLAPLEDWMEALYARLSDKDSLEQAVAESRTAMGEIEQALDDFFRHPQKVQQAQDSAAKLAKISSVLMVLDCDDASRAVTAMKDQVQQLVDAASQSGSIDDPDSQDNVLRLGNSLGALSFMLDMMGYQPDRARQQFHFDEATQELVHRNAPLVKPQGADVSPEPAPRPDDSLVEAFSRSGFSNTALPALESLADENEAGTLSAASAATHLGNVVRQAQLADQPALAQQARDALSEVQAAGDDPQAIAHAVASVVVAPTHAVPDDGITDALIDEEDLRDIFLEEAGEVIGNARTASEVLHGNPGDATQLTNLRRAF